MNLIKFNATVKPSKLRPAESWLKSAERLLHATEIHACMFKSPKKKKKDLNQSAKRQLLLNYSDGYISGQFVTFYIFLYVSTFFLFTAAPVACGSSRARGQVGAAAMATATATDASVTYAEACSSAGSLTH